MTLNPSGPMSLGGNYAGESIAKELGRNEYATISLNDSDVRALLGRSSGTISMSDAWGKSNKKEISFTFTTSVPNCMIDVHDIGGYVAGVSTVNITVNPGVYLYATDTGVYGLRIQGAIAGDTVTLTNYGYIIGCGGRGASYACFNHAWGPTSGGHALSLGCPVIINNQSFIAGGGGGGGGLNGGGGAGGGDGGWGCNGPCRYGGTGGGIGQRGNDGGSAYGGGAGGAGGEAAFQPTPCEPCHGGCWARFGASGGGRILPGDGGRHKYNPDFFGCGGSANNPSPSVCTGGQVGTGGGGWGAPAGVACGCFDNYRVGGPSIISYGNPISWISYGNLWGSVS